MKKLSEAEMKNVRGGTTYYCNCGFSTTNIFRLALHYGLKPWHVAYGGKTR